MKIFSSNLKSVLCKLSAFWIIIMMLSVSGMDLAAAPSSSAIYIGNSVISNPTSGSGISYYTYVSGALSSGTSTNYNVAVSTDGMILNITFNNLTVTKANNSSQSVY